MNTVNPTASAAARPTTNGAAPAPAMAPPAAHRPSRPIPDQQTAEGRRLTQRIGLLLGQRASLSKVMLVVLSAALLFSLIGLAVHALWIIAIIAMAAGLSYLYANNRRDHSDAIDQHQQNDLETNRRR